MKKNTLLYVSLGLLAIVPSVSFAALEGLTGLLCSVLGLLGLVEEAVFALALVFFFWGMGQFILHSGDQKARDEGKQKMVWGVVALFVMFSIMGILWFIGNTLAITPDSFASNSSCSTPAYLPQRTLQ